MRRRTRHREIVEKFPQVGRPCSGRSNFQKVMNSQRGQDIQFSPITLLSTSTYIVCNISCCVYMGKSSSSGQWCSIVPLRSTGRGGIVPFGSEDWRPSPGREERDGCLLSNTLPQALGPARRQCLLLLQHHSSSPPRYGGEVVLHCLLHTKCFQSGGSTTYFAPGTFCTRRARSSSQFNFEALCDVDVLLAQCNGGFGAKQKLHPPHLAVSRAHCERRQPANGLPFVLTCCPLVLAL